MRQINAAWPRAGPPAVSPAGMACILAGGPRGETQTMMPLNKLLVIDASRILAGPYCGQFFADHGAEVIKIEPPEGDINRAWPVVKDGASANYHSVNRGKKCITLNLRRPEAKDILHALIRKADVLIHNYLPETAEKLGVGQATLDALNENLIQVVIGGYGAKGPLAGKPGFDVMLTAFSGIMSLTGEKDRPPVRPGISAIDMSTGMLAFGAAMTALYARASGAAKGQRVDLSLLETAVSLLGYHGLNYLMAGVVGGRAGADFTGLVPYGRYRAKDGDLMIATPSPATWQRPCEVLDMHALARDPRFASNDGRVAHEPEFRAAFEQVLSAYTVREVTEILDRAGLANSPVQSVDQALTHQQVLANELVVETSSSDGTKRRLLGLPFKLSGTPGEIGPAAPELGEHTADILRRHLGYGDAEIAALRQVGAI